MLEWKRIWKLLVGVALLAISQPVSAAPLNPLTSGDPDLTVMAITLGYDAGTNQLTADGFPTNLHLAGSDFPNLPGTFELNAEIDETGALIGAMIMISGEILGTSHDGVLLIGTATAFGFDTAAPSSATSISCSTPPAEASSSTTPSLRKPR